MKKRILRHLLIGGFSVVILTFLITGSFMFGVVMRSALHEKENVLKSNVDRISELSSVTFSANSAPITSIYRTMIDNISENTGASIIVFDNAGSIVTVSGGGLQKSKYIGQTLKKELSEPILAGQAMSRTGILDGFFNETVLTVGEPMQENEQIFGGVIMNLPVPDINEMYWSLFHKLSLTVLIAMLFSSILFYYISQRITTPVKKMNSAVKEFAKGNFQKRVEYVSDDEMGELAMNFNDMADSLENLENMRSSFVANVSHELRTPMTTISGFIEGILDGTIAEEERDKYLEIVLSETKRLSRLVSDLLKIARMESGEETLHKREFDINELVRLVLIKFERAIDEKHLDVQLEFESDECPVYADSDSITQVLTNLMHNAVKFTPEDGFLHLRGWTYGNKAYIEVKNSGPGIEPDKINYVFDRFFKGDPSRGQDKSGVGLGLFIVRNIIAAHDEKIWVESEVDSFTKFTFSLTRARS